MRMGEVIGKLTLSIADEKLIGGRLLIVQPYDPESLRRNEPGTSEPLVVYDELGAGLGERVGFSEGREAAMPFYPDVKPIDAYNAAILDTLSFEAPPEL